MSNNEQLKTLSQLQDEYKTEVIGVAEEPEKIENGTFEPDLPKLIIPKKRKKKTPYESMPPHVQRSWISIKKSTRSVFKRSKWSAKYDQLTDLIEWVEGLR